MTYGLQPPTHLPRLHTSICQPQLPHHFQASFMLVCVVLCVKWHCNNVFAATQCTKGNSAQQLSHTQSYLLSIPLPMAFYLVPHLRYDTPLTFWLGHLFASRCGAQVHDEDGRHLKG